MANTSSEGVTHLLREHVMSGRLRPGERLRQEHLAQIFGVSRTPLRAALANLATEGLLEYESNRGYTVRSFDRKDIMDGYATRAVLEGLASATVARHGVSPATLDRLRAMLTVGDRAFAKQWLDPADLDDYRQMNVDLHDIIIAEARNRWVAELVRQTQLIPFASNRVIVWNDYDIMLRSHDDHHRLVNAIAARDPQRADAVMREHITFAGEYLARCIETGRIRTFAPNQTEEPA